MAHRFPSHFLQRDKIGPENNCNQSQALLAPFCVMVCAFRFRMNLYELIKKNNFQGFSLALIRRFAYSILQCLKVLHREKIIHCDLKPVSPISSSRTDSELERRCLCTFPARLGKILEFCQ